MRTSSCSSWGAASAGTGGAGATPRAAAPAMLLGLPLASKSQLAARCGVELGGEAWCNRCRLPVLLAGKGAARATRRAGVRPMQPAADFGSGSFSPVPRKTSCLLPVIEPALGVQGGGSGGSLLVVVAVLSSFVPTRTLIIRACEARIAVSKGPQNSQQKSQDGKAAGRCLSVHRCTSVDGVAGHVKGRHSPPNRLLFQSPCCTSRSACSGRMRSPNDRCDRSDRDGKRKDVQKMQMLLS